MKASDNSRWIAVLAAVVSSLMAGAAPIPHWISVMPLAKGCVDDLAEREIALGNETVVDGIAHMCTVHPEGDPVADKAAVYAGIYREIVPRVRAASKVPHGILLQATMGHGSAPGARTPWQCCVTYKGAQPYRFCPLDRRFLDYIARTCRTFSALKPDFFMVDDDTRIVWDDVPGCFCPLHLAEFSRRTGRPWTRQEVLARLEAKDGEVSKAWDRLMADSLAEFFRTIRANFDREIPGIFCVCGTRPHQRHAVEFARLLAAPGQKPAVRGSGAPYHGNDPYHVVNIRGFYAWQLAQAGGEADLLQECDTCPQTRWATSSTRVLDHVVMLALEGVKGAKIWITRMGNVQERKSFDAYFRMFRENRGLMAWAGQADFRQEGVVIPTCGPQAYNFGDRYLGLTGMPYRFGTAREGEVTALTGDTVDRLEDAEIARILRGRAILDGSAAIRLSLRGYGKSIGVEAKPWQGKAVRFERFADGAKVLATLAKGSADLTARLPGADERSRLYNVPAIGAEPQDLAPGSLRFDNAEGGRVFVFAQALPVQLPKYHQTMVFSETYRDELAKALEELAGTYPGGVRYMGDIPMLCESGTVGTGERVFVLDNLELDDDDEPEMLFAAVPSVIERLDGDGVWHAVAFERGAGGLCRLKSPVRSHRPAVFRFR